MIFISATNRQVFYFFCAFLSFQGINVLACACYVLHLSIYNPNEFLIHVAVICHANAVCDWCVNSVFVSDNTLDEYIG